MALAMLATAMRRKPAATSSGGRTGACVARATSRASAANFSATTAGSSGWSAFGPNTAGKKSGRSLPSITLQSVTVSGPPRR